MDYGKYIVVGRMGMETPVLFPSYVDHCAIASNFPEVLSAGLFQVVGIIGNEKDMHVGVFGESITLKLKARGRDAELIKRLLLGHY
jgi:hypothetical protein